MYFINRMQDYMEMTDSTNTKFANVKPSEILSSNEIFDDIELHNSDV